MRPGVTGQLLCGHHEPFLLGLLVGDVLDGVGQVVDHQQARVQPADGGERLHAFRQVRRRDRRVKHPFDVAGLVQQVLVVGGPRRFAQLLLELVCGPAAEQGERPQAHVMLVGVSRPVEGRHFHAVRQVLPQLRLPDAGAGDCQ
jgi:hypothetical protein